MASIIEMKQELTDIRAQLAQSTQRGYEMARNSATEIEALQAQSDAIDKLQVREQLLLQNIARQESAEGLNAAPAAGSSLAENKTGGFGSVGEFLNAVRNADAPSGIRDKRLGRALNTATGANETTEADGGYLVPPEYADGIIDMVQTQSILYPQARKVQIAGNRLIETYLDQQDRKDGPGGTRHGGILAYWKGEADQYQASKAKFRERTTQLSKLTAYCPCTEELLQDYPAIESVMSNLVGKEFAFKIDDAILHGTGDADMPLGILNAGNHALVTVAKESAQAAGSIQAMNLFKMFTSMIGQQRHNASWFINQDLELPLMQVMAQTGSIKSTGDSAVEKIVGTFGAPLYTPPGAYGNEDALILGKRVQPLEQCAAVGSVGDILFADPTQYMIIERTGITKQSSIHVRFDFDEVVFKFSWRVGGRPDWMSAIEGKNSTTSRSPYVTLAARA